ncbi:hemin ABC transporter substrate-binding protein [Lonsdalea britannica]|uniref:Hemin ABC transporter substrate-binding protein n=1 Tax=Lonsdalea britannica TaxID=1082704 RepID=A0AAD0SGV6_9GAMM|nr:hemin ABC transporter substrate-binding protein [Lonsdalea britannica]AXW87436.1 hemin ABC transporter substrate-binding protein [Lonsdalea britannica]OSM99933.1 hemin ABC transporter substrate-binding protein [Lonsdalea britannica]
MKKIFLLLALCLPFSLQAATRLVTIGGDVTQIVFALQAGGDVIARDSTSLHPQEALALPDVGYMRQLNAEGVLAMTPTLVLASELSQPSAAMEQIAKSGVKVVNVPAGQDVAGIAAKISVIAQALGKEKEGQALVRQVNQQLAELPTKPLPVKVLFILSHSGMSAMGAGQNTAADAAIRAAGLQNAMQGFNRYQRLSQEGVVASQPDWVVISQQGVKTLGGENNIWQLPGLALTPAGQHKRLLVVDDMAMLGFDLDTPAALLRLRNAVEVQP